MDNQGADWPSRGRETHLSGVDLAGGFAYELDLTRPGLALAIHAGRDLRPELAPWVLIGEDDRRREEDPATDQMIAAWPNRIWALASRAEYDLNRPRERAVPLTPEMYWGHQVYRDPLPPELRSASLARYDAFYAFIEALVRELLRRHRFLVIYDLHSYNLGPQIAQGHRPPPIFNLGTRLLDHARWRPALDAWLACLGRVRLEGMAVSVAENQVFGGQGELCRRISAGFERVLVLPTEVGKVYMDEKSGRLYPKRVAELGQALTRAMGQHQKSMA